MEYELQNVKPSAGCEFGSPLANVWANAAFGAKVASNGFLPEPLGHPYAEGDDSRAGMARAGFHPMSKSSNCFSNDADDVTLDKPAKPRYENRHTAPPHKLQADIRIIIHL